MRTDAHGRAVAPTRHRHRPYSAAALSKPFLTGAMIGIGVCVVMGPGLPVLGWGVSAASKSAEPVVAHLSRDWPVWRERLVRWTVAPAFARERHISR